MAQLPLEQAIQRFRGNEDRVDIFTNGGPTVNYISSSNVAVPSIQKFLSDKSVEINVGASSILSQCTAQATIVNNTGRRFLTPKSADPTTRDDATPLSDGDTYYNTTMATMRMRVSGTWQSAVPAGAITSITDTTPGRILTNNAFGLGLDGYPVTDANAATLNGFWTGNNLSNFPTTGFVVGFSAFRSSGASGVQLAMVLGTNGRLYRRHRVSSTWQAWQEVVSSVIGSTDGRTGQNVMPIGVDPYAWPTGFAGMQMPDGSIVTSAGATFVLDNLVNDGTNWRYVAASNAGIFSMSGSSMSYRTAGTGAANGIPTLTETFNVSPSFGVRSDRNGVLLPHDGFAARVNFNGTGIVATRASRNVSSVTDGGVGTYTVNFTTSMPNADYSVFGTAGNTAAVSAVRLAASVLSSASACTIEVVNSGGTLVDATTVNVGVVI